MRRRICWPHPDRVCFEGGCLWCKDYPYRTRWAIRRAAEQKDLLNAYQIGLERTGWVK